jgi:hypothetical protein
MKKSFITLAILIAIVPHLGFPQVWKDIFVSISAVLIIVLVVIPRSAMTPKEKTKRETSFIENLPQSKETAQTTVLHEETLN